MPTIFHFDLPADDQERAKKFYEKLFDWKFVKVPATKLGGNIIRPKTAVPGWGYLAICIDTENNTFGLWEEDMNVK